MMHSDIDKADTLERYVRNKLAPDERRAFEEHFLSCDDCFEKLQATERFAAGIRDAADRGLLDPRSQSKTANPVWFGWLFAATACIALISLGLAGWAYFWELPRLRSELRETAQLRNDPQFQLGTEQALPLEQAEANVPLLMLQASRATQAVTSVSVRPVDKQIVLWIEPGPTRYHDFRVEVFSSDNRLLTSVDHLVLNRYRALAASLPTKQLPAGRFRLTLTGQAPPPAALAGEYQVEIRRP
jgi:hypothetical protein